MRNQSLERYSASETVYIGIQAKAKDLDSIFTRSFVLPVQLINPRGTGVLALMGRAVRAALGP